MVRTQIQLTEKQATELRRLAAEKGISMAEIIRQAVDVILQFSYKISYDEQKLRALKAAGAFRSGLGDIAVEHDKYVSEDFES